MIGKNQLSPARGRGRQLAGVGKGNNESSKPKGIVTKFSGDNRKLKQGIRVAGGFMMCHNERKEMTSRFQK